MGWHEDFADEPSIEERMPFGVSPEEMRATCEAVHLADEEEFVLDLTGVTFADLFADTITDTAISD